uniref:Uncharacterized protein n=1 Tax=Anguilla anguilla TaxID=7936 RepID=A0A0E9QBR2_ANGAN
MTSANVEFMLLTETQLKPNERSQRSEPCPLDYDCFSLPRLWPCCCS